MTSVRLIVTLLILCSCLGCRAGWEEDGAERIAFVDAFNATSEREDTGCRMSAGGRFSHKIQFDCPAVEAESVAEMVKAFCGPLLELGFKRVDFTSEAQPGRCSPRRCTCALEAPPAIAPTGAQSELGRDGGPVQDH